MVKKLPPNNDEDDEFKDALTGYEQKQPTGIFDNKSSTYSATKSLSVSKKQFEPSKLLANTNTLVGAKLKTAEFRMNYLQNALKLLREQQSDKNAILYAQSKVNEQKDALVQAINDLKDDDLNTDAAKFLLSATSLVEKTKIEFNQSQETLENIVSQPILRTLNTIIMNMNKESNKSRWSFKDRWIDSKRDDSQTNKLLMLKNIYDFLKTTEGKKWLFKNPNEQKMAGLVHAISAIQRKEGNFRPTHSSSEFKQNYHNAIEPFDLKIHNLSELAQQKVTVEILEFILNKDDSLKKTISVQPGKH